MDHTDLKAATDHTDYADLEAATDHTDYTYLKAATDYTDLKRRGWRPRWLTRG